MICLNLLVIVKSFSFQYISFILKCQFSLLFGILSKFHWESYQNRGSDFGCWKRRLGFGRFPLVERRCRMFWGSSEHFILALFLHLSVILITYNRVMNKIVFFNIMERFLYHSMFLILTTIHVTSGNGGEI